MHKGFFAETLARRPLLMHAILEANRLCGPSPQDGDGIAGRVERALWAAPADRARLHRAWSKMSSDASSGCGARPFVFWDYAEESRRLALLPPELLLRAAEVFGVAVHAPDVAREVRRAEVQALRCTLGEDMYRYALYRGQYQMGSVRDLFTGRNRDVPLPLRVRLHGAQALALCARRWPEALRRRVLTALAVTAAREDRNAQAAWDRSFFSRRPAVAFPVPAEFDGLEWDGNRVGPRTAMPAHGEVDRKTDSVADADGFAWRSVPPLQAWDLPKAWPQAVGDEDRARRVWQALKKLLIREVAPSWAPCFD